VSGAAGRENRLQELDAFRGIAALWVVLFHFVARYPRLFGDPRDLDDFALAFGEIFSAIGGLLPVFLFFMISGFVITWTLERSASWRDFLVSRFSRLYPAYWAAVALTLAAMYLVPLPGDAVTFGRALANITMLQDFLGPDSLDGSWWSLDVELLFYAWMLLALVFGKLGRMAWIALFWACLCGFAHALARYGVATPWHARRYLLLDFGHFFAAGIALYEFWRGRGRWLNFAVLALCAASMMLSYPLPHAITCVGFIALFLLALAGKLRWIAAPPLLRLGRVSYALYICHEAIGFRVIWLLDGAGLPHLVSAALAIIVVLALAAAITRFVEQPAMRRLRALWRSGRGNGRAVSANAG
jgi:peptidoglycan/LPS O-acetylase OafA/YrhL